MLPEGAGDARVAAKVEVRGEEPPLIILSWTKASKVAAVTPRFLSESLVSDHARASTADSEESC